jgi:hypothetical protein
VGDKKKKRKSHKKRQKKKMEEMIRRETLRRENYEKHGQNVSNRKTKQSKIPTTRTSFDDTDWADVVLLLHVFPFPFFLLLLLQRYTSASRNAIGENLVPKKKGGQGQAKRAPSNDK